MSGWALAVGAGALLADTGPGQGQAPAGRDGLDQALRAVLREARGVAAVLVPPAAGVFAALRALAPGDRPELLALVPNVVEYLRDSSEAGLVGAAVRRLRRATPRVAFRLARHGLAHAPRILARESDALLAILLELELAGFDGLRPSAVVLAAPWTDLALAAGNVRFFESFARHIRRIHRARPCLETNNGGHLLERLTEWGVDIDVVVTAVNPRGFRMKPTMAHCLAQVRGAPCRVSAREITAGGTVPLQEGVAFARASGAAGIVLDLTSPEDIALIRQCRMLWEESAHTIHDAP